MKTRIVGTLLTSAAVLAGTALTGKYLADKTVEAAKETVGGVLNVAVNDVAVPVAGKIIGEAVGEVVKDVAQRQMEEMMIREFFPNLSPEEVRVLRKKLEEIKKKKDEFNSRQRFEKSA